MPSKSNMTAWINLSKGAADCFDTQDPLLIELMWNAARMVSKPDEGGFPDFEPGYWEFAYRKGSIVFMDYKISGAYTDMRDRRKLPVSGDDCAKAKI